MLCETLQLLGVGGFGVPELVVDHAQLFPVSWRADPCARLAEAAALTGCLPLSQPERLALRPALGLVGVVVGEQVVEVLEVALQRLLDVAQLLEAALEIARATPASRRARPAGPRCAGGRSSRRPTRACTHCRARRTPAPTRRGIVDNGEIREEMSKQAVQRTLPRWRVSACDGAPSHHESPGAPRRRPETYGRGRAVSTHALGNRRSGARPQRQL